MEREMDHYTVLQKGDTINAQYGGRNYAIDVVETRPDDKIDCIGVKLEVHFDTPKDE